MNKYEWKISIILKNGEILKGIYETDKTNSMEVAEEMLPEYKPTNIFAFRSENANETVFVVATEVAAFKIGI